MASIIYANGSVEVTVAASSKLSVYSLSACKIYQLIDLPNFPASWDLLATTTSGEEYLSSAFSAATTVRIDAGPSEALYATGTNPSAYQAAGIVNQPTPTAKTTDATLTIAELLTKILTGTHAAGATQTYTLPTGTLTDAGVDMQIDDAFDWVLINLSAAAADTVTVAAGTDHTLVGNAVVQSAHATTGALYGNSAQFRTRKTAANTFVTYRIA